MDVGGKSTRAYGLCNFQVLYPCCARRCAYSVGGPEAPPTQDLQLLNAALYVQNTRGVVHALKGGGPRITQELIHAIKVGDQPRLTQDLLHVLYDPNSAASGHGRRRMVVLG